ncbi:MAG: hypothetical protein J0I19_14830 [Alphaproteobacteria bacterium]|nr:hypothetical protein [Alphaproteobacteria bacterium]
MAVDRIVRLLSALDGAATSRVLNLRQIARANAHDKEHGEKPLFLSPPINTAFVIKHRVRSDETYLFASSRSVATKIVIPFDPSDLRAGGRSIFIDQRGFADGLRTAGHYSPEKLERDTFVMRLLNAIPSLDPFLLREHLRNNGIEVASCYFAISAGDQERMHEFVSQELSQLVRMANGDDGNGASTGRMVTAMLSSQVDEKLEPLRLTLGLSGNDFREGAFSWRGFLYYKWAMERFWPRVMNVLREITMVHPTGPVTAEQAAYLTAARRDIVEMVHDYGQHIAKVLSIYDHSFGSLVASQSPKTFRDFLLSAPSMFLELGERMGAISHIVSFWRYRFADNRPIDAEELGTIFQDFTSGFAERMKSAESPIPRPMVIEG